MASRKKKSPSGPGRILANLLLWNILPLGAFAVIGFLYLNGEIQIKEVPAEATQTIGVLVAALVLLLLVASLSLPAAHTGVVRIRGGMARGSAILGGREEGSKFLALVAIPFFFLGYLVMWVVRFVLTVLSFALIAVVVVFMIRLFEPEFLEDRIAQVLAWRPADWGI